MVRDETVFVLGEEVAQYNGAYKVRQDYDPYIQGSGSHFCSLRSPRVCWTSSERSALSIPVSLCNSSTAHSSPGPLTMSDTVRSHYRSRILWIGCRSRIRRSQASLRVHDVQLCHASHRSNRQLGRQDVLHVWRVSPFRVWCDQKPSLTVIATQQRALPCRLPWPERCRRGCRCSALSGLRM